MEWKTWSLGILVGLLLSPFLFWLLVKFGLWLLKRKLNQLVQRLGSVSVPLDITLKPLNTAEWEDSEVKGQAHDLQQLGLQSIGAFEINEMPGVRLSAWHHPNHHLFGVVYRHPRVGVWCDLVSRYSNGTSCTHTTAPKSGLDQNPDHPNHRCDQNTPAQLLQAHLNARPPHPLSQGPDQFVELFLQAYRRDREWRINRGTSPQEIAQVAALTRGEVDTETLELAHKMHQASDNRDLERLLREKFLATNSLSASEWDKIQDRVVFVHDRLSSEELESLGILDSCHSGSARQQARQSRARFLGSLHEPFEVDVYMLPENIEA